MAPPTNHLFGTLVDPDQIPLVTYHLGAIESAAGKLRGLGGDVRTAGVDINSAWQRLGGSYRAPETSTLLAATAPIMGRADNSAAAIEQAGGVLSGFAGEMPGHLRRLEQVRTEAVAFVGWARAQPHGAWQEGRYDNCLGSAYNENLAGSIADAVKAVEDCERKYGDQMARLVDARLLPAPADPGAPATVNPHDPDRLHPAGDWRDVDATRWGLPWGGPMTQDQIYSTFGKPSPFQNFLGNFLKTYYLAPLSMLPFVGLNPNLDGGSGDDIHPHPSAGDLGWHVMRSAWGGVGKVVLAATPIPDLVSSKLHRMNMKTRTAFLDSFLDRKDGSAAARAGVITGNLLGLITPSPADAAYADLAGRGARMAEHGTSLTTRLAGHALQTPEWLASGRFVGAEFRAAAGGVRRIADHFGVTMPSLRQIVFPHHTASVHEPGTGPVGDDAARVSASASARHTADEILLRGQRERREILADGADRSQRIRDLARDRAGRIQEDTQRRANEVQDQFLKEKDRLTADGDHAGAARARDAGFTESSRIAADGRAAAHRVYDEAKRRADGVMDQASRRAAERRDQYLGDYETARGAQAASAAHEARQRAGQAAAAGSVHPGAGATPGGHDGSFLPPQVHAAWNSLPESLRIGILSVVRYENGPVATASGMPADWLLGVGGGAPGDPAASQQAAIVMDYLSRHPDAVRHLWGLDRNALVGSFVVHGTTPHGRR
jgi:hypothetical protein